MSKTFRQRFDEKWSEDHVTGCWNWTASTNYGYGQIKASNSRKTVKAHRASYEMFVGAVPDDLVIDHLCRNRACVNPEHLEPVENGENVLRGVSDSAENARKTHCHRGHEFTLENTYTYVAKGKAPARLCRKCRAGWAKVTDPIIGNPKLSEAQVARIRFLHALGDVTQRSLARQFKVTPSTISSIVRGKSWATSRKAV